jgi:ubiquinone/menaquinone biosynthesis C-methylase UbiE
MARDSMTTSPRERVRRYWQRDPCGATDVTFPEGTREFFEEVQRQRFEGDDFMLPMVGFDRWSGRRVLEVGCGLGTDLLQFARGAARVVGTDLTEHAARLTRQRLAMYGVPGSAFVADAERLPFASSSFDLVYSWGVIHHAPDARAAASEIVRVCRPEGRVMVMLYHRRSLFALQVWLVYGLLRGRPDRSIAQVVARHVESPGTKAYTRREAALLFSDLRDLRVHPVVTRYDVRLGRRRFLPAWVRRLVPAGLGWFLVITGAKPADPGLLVA